MSRSRTMKLIAGVALPAAMLGLLLACSTDSPTAPQQQAGPPSGGPSAAWSIEITLSPREIPADSANPVTVKIKVRRADDNTAPPLGTTLVVSTSLGEFNAVGSGLSSIATGTVNGRAEVLLFPGALVGSAIVTAQLESSATRATLKIREALPDLLAAFSATNTTDNLSIQFLNESTGGPTSFAWDFGDGLVSSEEHPVHRYNRAGDYVVTLEVFRGNETSKISQTVRVTQDVFITDIDPRFGTFGSTVTVKGQGFDSQTRVFFGGFLTEKLSFSGENIRVRIPSENELAALFPSKEVLFDNIFGNETCDDDEDGHDGERWIATFKDVEVEVSGEVGGDTIEELFLWEPSDTSCRGDEAP